MELTKRHPAHRPGKVARLSEDEEANGTALTPEALTSFAGLFRTEEDYCRIMGDLCTIREHLSRYFEFADAPLHGNFEHPIFKIACTLNNIIGSLLNGDYRLLQTSTTNGSIIRIVRKSAMFQK